MMAQKTIDDVHFEKWYKRYDKTNTSGDADKKQQLAALYAELEQDMDFVGCSAIEDLLQDQVPETIQLCLEANIKVWVLTGDKQETAIEIGKSCNLIN